MEIPVSEASSNICLPCLIRGLQTLENNKNFGANPPLISLQGGLTAGVAPGVISRRGLLLRFGYD